METMYKGQEVKIVSANGKYASELIGKTGVVERVSSGTMFGVRIQGFVNARSGLGLFWFEQDDIEFTNKEKDVMLSQNENFKVAGVKFIDGSNCDKEYFYALFDDCQEGQLVVVQTGHHGLAIARISSVSNDDKNRVQCSREIICPVDLKAFEERKEKRAAIAKLKKDMDEKVKMLQETALYEMLAEKDESLAAMLSSYKELTKQ